MREHAMLTERLAVSIHLSAPDKRWYDIDERTKCLMDALGSRHAGIYKDDRQIDEIHKYRCAPMPPHGQVIVTIKEISG